MAGSGDDSISSFLRKSVRLLVRVASLHMAGILKALEIGIRQPELRTRLWENADYFHAQLRSLGFDTGPSTTYIMPIVIGDRARMYRLGHELRRRGLRVAPVDYPAVPQNRVCFRACVTANHTRADLDEALNILADTLVRRCCKIKAPDDGEQVSRHSRIEATYKAREVEGAVDVYFYRPLGFRLAEFSRSQTDAGGRQSAGGCLRCHGRTSLFLPEFGINIAGMSLMSAPKRSTMRTVSLRVYSIKKVAKAASSTACRSFIFRGVTFI